VGPGRGSGAGSLVAYALKITDLDPLQLQPAVRALPESGAGVHARLRHRLLPGPTANLVIDYVKSKYGKDAVSQIATFGTMAARGVVRDVGRVLDMSYTFCDGIAKLIPNKPGTNVTLQLPLTTARRATSTSTPPRPSRFWPSAKPKKKTSRRCWSWPASSRA